MVTLKNSELTVKVNEMGAELRSIVYNGTEYIWEGKPEIWSGTAPIMFPICGGLKEDKYLLNGKEYTLTKHGFAKLSLFEVESATDTCAVFLLRSSEDTLVSYPFDFEFRVIYTLDGKALKVDYKVDNKSADTMYFNVGAHEAYATPEGIEDYDVLFDSEQTLSAQNLYGNILAHTSYPIIKDSKVLPLYDKYFILDALPFKDIAFKAATLRNRKTGRAIRIDFPDAPYFLLWHKHGAGYMCLEPWNGIPDVPGSSYDITEKEGITALASSETFIFTHTITVVE